MVDQGTNGRGGPPSAGARAPTASRPRGGPACRPAAWLEAFTSGPRSWPGGPAGRGVPGCALRPWQTRRVIRRGSLGPRRAIHRCFHRWLLRRNEHLCGSVHCVTIRQHTKAAARAPFASHLASGILREDQAINQERTATNRTTLDTGKSVRADGRDVTCGAARCPLAEQRRPFARR